MLGSRQQLRVVLLDRSGVNHQLCALNVLGIVSHGNGNAAASDAIQVFRLIGVRAGNKISFVVQNLCDWTHARTADTYKMDVLFMT